MDTIKVATTIKSWVEMHSDTMFSWALYKTSSKETAEDLVQETFLVVMQSVEKFEGKSNPKTWLFSILNNKINDYHRKRYKNPTVTERIQSKNGEILLFEMLFDDNGHWKTEECPMEWSNEPENILDDTEFNKTLQNCMQKLPDLWFSALQLKYLEERDGEVICQELQITPTNFWQILHRAKLQMRKCLELNWFKK